MAVVSWSTRDDVVALQLIEDHVRRFDGFKDCVELGDLGFPRANNLANAQARAPLPIVTLVPVGAEDGRFEIDDLAPRRLRRLRGTRRRK